MLNILKSVNSLSPQHFRIDYFKKNFFQEPYIWSTSILGAREPGARAVSFVAPFLYPTDCPWVSEDDQQVVQLPFLIDNYLSAPLSSVEAPAGYPYWK